MIDIGRLLRLLFVRQAVDATLQQQQSNDQSKPLGCEKLISVYEANWFGYTPVASKAAQQQTLTDARMETRASADVGSKICSNGSMGDASSAAKGAPAAAGQPVPASSNYSATSSASALSLQDLRSTYDAASGADQAIKKQQNGQQQQVQCQVQEQQQKQPGFKQQQQQMPVHMMQQVQQQHAVLQQPQKQLNKQQAPHKATATAIATAIAAATASSNCSSSSISNGGSSVARKVWVAGGSVTGKVSSIASKFEACSSGSKPPMPASSTTTGSRRRACPVHSWPASHHSHPGSVVRDARRSGN